jgi:recombination protein RecA
MSHDMPSKQDHGSLDRTLQQIEKNFGKGAIMKLNEGTLVREGLSTGALSLDLALGGYGIPRGRVVEMFGPESSGKTTLALHVVASAQRAGGVAAFIDAEHALDPTWVRKCGVKLEELLVSQPDTGEQAMEIVEMLVRSNAVDCVVVDSVAALVPRAELEGEMGQQHVGLQARLMSQGLRKLTGCIAKSKCIVIFINQIRDKIGVMYGSPETTPGGRALKFYSSIRVDIRRITSIKEGEVTTGNRVKAKVVKNKVAAPFKQAEFDIMFDGGISTEGDLIDMAANEGIIDKTGAWFSYGQVRIGQGKENAKQFIRDNPELMSELRNAVLAKIAADNAAAVASKNGNGHAATSKPAKAAEGDVHEDDDVDADEVVEAIEPKREAKKPASKERPALAKAGKKK